MKLMLLNHDSDTELPMNKSKAANLLSPTTMLSGTMGGLSLGVTDLLVIVLCCPDVDGATPANVTSRRSSNLSLA